MPGMARRQMRRRTIAGAAITASAVSSARTNRAVRKNIEAQTDQAQNQQNAPADQGGGSDLEMQLQELKNLLEKNLITEEEYNMKKQELLGL